MREYQWKDGARVPRGLKPDVVGAVVEKIQERKGGKVTPQAVLEASRKPTAALHSAFEWDNEIAGERYRLSQANYYLRTLMVRVEIADREPLCVRAVVTVTEKNAEGERINYYMDTVGGLKDDSWRGQIIGEVIDGIRELRHKLETYQAVIDSFGPTNLRLAEIITDLENEKEEIGNAESTGSGVYQTAAV